MKQGSTNLVDYLATLSENPQDTELFAYDLYTIVLNTTPSATLYFTNCDQPITTNYGALSGFTIANGGTGYAPGDSFGIGGSGTQGAGVVDTVGGGGVVLTAHATNSGKNYQAQNGVRTFGNDPQPGVGTGLTLNITAFSSPQTYNILTVGTPNAPVVGRLKTNSKRGLEVTTAEFALQLLPTMQINGKPMLQEILLGAFDEAAVTIQRITMPTFGDMSLGLLTVFAGYIANIENITRTGAKFTVNSWTDVLNVMMPRNLYTPGCRHSLYDPGCTISRGAFTYSGVVQSGSNAVTVKTNLSKSGPLAAPASAPSLSQYTVAKANVGPATYYAVVTYVTADGETLPSPPNSFSCGGRGGLLKVNSPPSVSGAIGYNVYVGFGNGYNLQAEGSDGSSGAVTHDAPYPIGYQWSMPGDGWTQGPPPPAQNTSGFFTLGVLTFTSGGNSGLSYSIQDYQNPGSGGVVTLVRGTLATPAPGDTFTIVAGCDKSMTTCREKFNNLANFAGVPFIPTPEAVTGGAGGQGT